MLKVIPSVNDKKLLSEDGSIADILNKLEEQYKKKKEKPNEKSTNGRYYEKILVNLSMNIEEKSFEFNKENEEILKEIIAKCYDCEIYNVHQDLYGLFKNKDFKKTVLNSLNFDEKINKKTLENNIGIMMDYIVNEETNKEIMEKFAEGISKNKNFHILNSEKLRKYCSKLGKILKENKEVKNSKVLSKLSFFLRIGTPEIIEESFEKFELNEELKDEKKFYEIIQKREYSGIDSLEKMKENYGERAWEIIKGNAKQLLIQICLSKLVEKEGKTILSFEEIEKEMKVKFNDISFEIADGSENGFFCVNIDYETKAIKVLSIKSKNRSKKNLEKIRKDIDEMINGLENIMKLI